MTTCFPHSLFAIFVWQSVNIEPLLNISVWQRAKVITCFMNCEWKWLKSNGFSSISILRKHFANNKSICTKINAIFQTSFTHSLNFLCQPYLTFAHCLFCECQCDLSFAHCQKCTPFSYIFFSDLHLPIELGYLYKSMWWSVTTNILSIKQMLLSFLIPLDGYA